MKLLLDTHLILWAASSPERLSKKALDFLSDNENALFFSAANLWAITIKNGLGRADFKVDVSVLRRGLLDNGYNEIPITSQHAIAVSGLPGIHRDPFDRVLVAQAITEGITLLTADKLVAQYSGPIIDVG